MRDSRRLPSDRGIFVEQIEPQVFQRALDRTDNVDLLFNHNPKIKLGSTNEGNLNLREDAVGLFADCTVFNPDVIEKARNDELRGWSFGFIKRQDEWDTTVNPQRRFIKDLDLLEVSVLSVAPAYTAMSIEARGDETVVVEQRFDVFEKVEIIEEKRKEPEVKDDPGLFELENYLAIKK